MKKGFHSSESRLRVRGNLYIRLFASFQNFSPISAFSHSLSAPHPTLFAMKTFVSLALVGLSAAAPAVVRESDSVGYPLIIRETDRPTASLKKTISIGHLPSWSTLTPGGHVEDHWEVFPRPAEAADGAESSGDEAEVSATLGVDSTRTSVTTSTKTQTLATPTRTVTAPPKTTTATTTKTSVATAPARTTTRTSVITSTKTTSKADPTSSASPDDSSDSGDEAEASFDADLDGFMGLPTYSRIAQDEDTPCPYVQAFSNRNATAIHQPIETHNMTTYNAKECSQFCNSHLACKAFGIFIERQPSCTNCSDPTSTEANMCELYNTVLDPKIVTDNSTSQRFGNKRFTMAIRASNGYNKLGEIQTVSVTVTARAGLETVYRTRTVTSSGRSTATVTSTRSSGATTTVHHTLSASSNSTRTITTTSSQPARTVYSTSTVYGTPYTRTVTMTQYTNINMPTVTRTTTITRTAAASPATTTKTSTASPTTRTVTRTSSASPTTRVVTSTRSASPTTVTKTSTKPTTVTRSGSASPETTTTARQTVVVSVSGSAGTVTRTSTKTTLATRTSTETSVRTTTKTASAQATQSVEVGYSSNEEEEVVPYWE